MAAPQTEEEATPNGVDADAADTATDGPPAEGRRAEAPEPPEATHGAEDEAWETDGQDTPHLEDEVVVLRARVAELEDEATRLKDNFLRARADYDNLTRRTESERERTTLQAAGRIIGELLEPLDVLARAAADAAGSKDAHAEGIRMTHKSLWQALAREGLEEVPGVDAPFDVAVHEAIARAPSDRPEGTVVEVVRPGYLLRGRLLRPALVKVSSGPDASD